jgi:hypothetical protein
MVEDLAEIAAVDPAIAGRAADKVLGIIRRRLETATVELRGIVKRTPGRGVQSSAGGLFLSREPLGGHSLSKLHQ